MDGLVFVRHGECNGAGELTSRGVAHALQTACVLKGMFPQSSFLCATSSAPRAEATAMLMKGALCGGAVSELLPCEGFKALNFPDNKEVSISPADLLQEINNLSDACDVLICVTHREIVISCLNYCRVYCCLCSDVYTPPEMAGADALVIYPNGEVVHISPYLRIGI